MPESSPRRPPGRWLQLLLVGLVVGLIGGGYLVHLLTRPDAVRAGTFVSGTGYNVPYYLARFTTPDGQVAVRVSVPLREIPGTYDADEVRLARDTRAVRINVEGRGVERLSLMGGLALIAGDHRYDLAPVMGKDQWLVVPGDGRDLQVDLEWDGEHQGVRLADGQAEPGLAAALGRVGTPRIVDCRVVAQAPSGRRHPVARSCPSIYLAEAVWLDEEGWVGAADSRWLDVYGLDFRDVYLADTSQVWPVGTPTLRAHGERLRSVGDERWRGQTSGTTTRLTVTSAARRYVGGKQEPGWRVRVEVDVEAGR